MTTTDNPTDLASFGIGADDAQESGLSTLDLNDPTIAELIRSFSDDKPDPVKALAEIEVKVPAQDEDPAEPDGTAAEPPLPEPTGSPAPAPGPELYTIDLGDGKTATVSQQQVKSLMELDNWAKGLPRETAEAMAAVEDGRGYVIPRDEAEAYRAWKAAGSRGPAASTTPTFSDDDYSSDAERALAAEVAELKAGLAQTRDAQVQSQSQVIQDRQRAEAQARAEIFGAAFTDTGAASGLTPEQTNAALQYAFERGIIKDVNDSMSQFSPTGQLLRLPDASTVATETLRRAIDSIPELRQLSIEAEVQSRLEAERSAILTTNDKKNRAASLATAPSASTPSFDDVRAMTPQQREAAMARDIKAAWDAG